VKNAHTKTVLESNVSGSDESFRMIWLPLQDWTQFIPDLVATIVGVGLGVYAAHRVERWQSRRRQRTEEVSIRGAVHNAIQHNVELARQLAEIAQTMNVPTFSVDPGLLDELFARLATTSADYDYLDALNSFRYQLRHLERKVDEWLRWDHERWGPSANRHERRDALMSSIQEHYDALKQLADTRLNYGRVLASH